MSDPSLAVGIDIGGTNLRAALVDADGAVVDVRRAPRRAGADGFADEVWDLVGVLDGQALPLGLGVASIVRGNAVAVYGPNLPIGEVDLVAVMRERGAVSVIVENDANAAMFGEWRVGAARGHDDALMLTLGTGVGGGVVSHGTLVRGANGFGGEAGHVPLVPGGRRCACGRLGCLEAYASGAAMAVEAAERLATGAPSLLHDVDVLDGAAVSEAAGAGDALAIASLVAVGHWLGTGLVGMVNLLDPAVIVIGGGAANSAGPWVLPAARAVLEAEIEGASRRRPPPLVPAQLGDDAGIIGAGLLAQAHHHAGPDMTQAQT